MVESGESGAPTDFRISGLNILDCKNLESPKNGNLKNREPGWEFTKVLKANT